MNKPQGYDETKEFGEFEVLPAGGHKCLIKKVVCEKTQAGKDYLKIGFDIADGKYKDFYQKKFNNDIRSPEERKWSGIWTVFIEGYNPETTNPKFKGLITSVEMSNNGFKFNFNEQELVGKKVGIVFREEEFIGQDGEIHTTTKPFYAVSYENVEETKIPMKKSIKKENNPFATNEFTPVEDDELPF